MLNPAYSIRKPDSLLGSIRIRKTHINILSIKANPSPRDLG